MENSARTPFAALAKGVFTAATVGAILAVPGGMAIAQSSAPYTVLETGKGYDRLQEAVSSIRNGTGTIAIANGVHRQCAVQQAGDITYLADEPGKAIFDGVECEGKAALVLRGNSATVSGLVFQNMRVRDFNGAGIRIEIGDLTVTQSWFKDSEQGILGGIDQDARIVIDKSTFTRLGTCEGRGGCAHSVYIGDYGHARITRSRFEEGRGGHYVKIRAGRVEIAASSFDDSKGRGTNYMIDLPGGAAGQITNNWFVQGQNKENHSAFITIAPEGKQHDSSQMVIAGNDARFATGVSRNTTFVGNWTSDPVQIGDNRLAPGIKVSDRR